MDTNILDHLGAVLASHPAARRVGRVSGLGGGLVRVTGLSDAMALGDRVSFAGTTPPSGAEVVSLEGTEAVLLSDRPTEGLHLGQDVLHDGPVTIAPSAQWVGRVVDPDGRPLDGAPLQQGARRVPLLPDVESRAGRRGLGARLETGLAITDTFLPIVRGQRVGIFSGAGVGKSTLLARLALGIRADVTVLALVGERSREVRNFTEQVLGPAGMQQSIVVAAPADRSPLVRRRAAETAMTIAEFFRDQGLHVLLLVDSVTRFADAHREVAMAGGESPAMAGYPASMVPRIMSLVERSGPGIGSEGDITAVFNVLVPGSDMDGPVADTLRGVLDGHIVLDRRIAERGRFPAVDVLRSVSRALPECATDEQNALLSDARRILAAHEQSELMVQAGLHVPGSDPELDRVLDLWPRLESFLSGASPDGITASFQRLQSHLTGKGGDED